MGSYVWYVWTYGGPEMRNILRFEVWQRITGSGDNPPHGASLPVPIYLLYYNLPVSVLAVGALLLVHPLQWFSRRSQTALPLYWVLAFLIPYSLSHGFRPDYIFPAYAATALLAAAGIERLMKAGARRRGPTRVAYEMFRGAPTALGIVVLLGCLRYLVPQVAPEVISKNLPIPWFVAQETWYILGGLAAVAAVVIVVGVWASLSWKPRLLVGLIAVAMLGVQFLHTHMVSPHARSGDGVKMRDFALAAREHVDRQDPLLLFGAEKLTTECYLGRLGTYCRLPDPNQVEGQPPLTFPQRADRLKRTLESRAGRWFITTDQALLELGAYRRSPEGKYKLSDDARFTTYPAQLGEVVLQSHYIRFMKHGCAYLIRLREDIETTSQPYVVGYVRYRPEDEW
jgi:hypothetical protein